MKNRIVKFSLLTLALTAFTFASAQEDKKADKDAIFKTMDKNNDGMISNAEFEPKEAKKEIMKARMEEKLKERFAKLDKDGNGSVSFEEYKMATIERHEENKGKRKPRRPRK